jgi:hypothetical protein
MKEALISVLTERSDLLEQAVSEAILDWNTACLDLFSGLTTWREGL